MGLNGSHGLQVGKPDAPGANEDQMTPEGPAASPLRPLEPESSFDYRSGGNRRSEKVGEPESRPQRRGATYRRAQVEATEDEQAGGIVDPGQWRFRPHVGYAGGADPSSECCDRQERHEDQSYYANLRTAS
jgi:hypothetical protein